MLEGGSPFPCGFEKKKLNEEDEDQRKTKSFADEIIRFHQLIKDGNLNEIKTIKQPDDYFYGGKHSAAYTAIFFRNFKIYDYFKSIGHDFDEDEVDFEDKSHPNYFSLDKAERAVIREIKEEYLPRDELSSKCRPISFEHKEFIKALFKELNKIEEISIVLKVAREERNLQILLDFDSDSTKNLCLLDADGITFPNELKVCIAAGKWAEDEGKKQIFATVAHEVTHMVMHLIFNNDMKPYSKSNSRMKSVFDKWKAGIHRMDLRNSSALRTLLGAFAENYEELDQVDAELIARIPDILAQDGDAGREWLKKHVSGLFKFYEKRVIPKCKTFIDECRYRGRKCDIQQFNETVGEIKHIRNNRLASFTKINELQKILNNEKKNSFILTTESTSLSLVRVLQATCKKGWMKNCNSFLVFKLENFTKNLDDVKELFYSIPCDMLIIEIAYNPENSQEIESKIETILQFNTLNKKMVFVMKENNNEFFERIVKNLWLWDEFVKEKDQDFSLWDLEDNPKRKILEKKLLFQGRKIALRDLVNDNENLQRCVNSGMIEKLLESEEFEIGSKIFGISDLEGAYADVLHEIDSEMLKYEINKNVNIFIFSEIEKDELVNYLGEEFEIHIGEFEEKPVNYSKKLLLFSKFRVTDRQFQRFCNYKSEKEIYLIEENRKSELILRRLYNPNFYSDRNFKKKIILTKDIQKMANESDTFLIENIDGIEIPDDEKKDNIKWVDKGKADDEFRKLSLSENNIHLIKFENDEFVWIKSKGSLYDLRRLISGQEVPFIKEMELVEEIQTEKVVIFSDDPGMGKSTSLVNLYETKYRFKKSAEAVSLKDTHWILFVKLIDHPEAIRNIRSSDLNVDGVIAFLIRVDPKLGKEKICRKLLKYALTQDDFPKPLLIVFDGFDEVRDENDREKAASLLEFIAKSTKAKLWVTTRLHFKDLLEEKLSKFAIEFEPIQNDGKKLFIKDYMKARSKLTLKEDDFKTVFGEKEETQDLKIWTYATKFIDKTESIFKGDIKRFIGTPLQLHLLLENSISSFVEWAGQREEDPDFSYLGDSTNIFKVFEKYFDKKYEIYFRKNNIQNGLDMGIKEIVMKYHEKYYEKLAEARALNSELLPEILEPYRTQILSAGLVRFVNDNFEFVQFTFKEYFLVQLFVKNLMKFLKEKQNEEFERKLRNLMEDIFLKKGYHLTCSFINLKLETLQLSDDYKKGFSRIIDLLRSPGTEIPIINLFLLLVIAIEEGHDRIFELFFLNGLSDSDYATILPMNNNPKNETLLQLAAKTGNGFIWDLIVSKAGNDQLLELLNNPKNKSNKLALHLAAENGHIEIVKKIVEVIPKIRLLPFLFQSCRFEFLEHSPLGLAIGNCHHEVVEFLFKIMIDNVTKKNKPKIFGFGLKVKNKEKTILQLAADKGCLKMFTFIFRKAESVLKLKKNLKEVLLKKTMPNGYDVLAYAIISKRIDLIEFILQKFKDISLDHDFLNIKDLFHSAASSKNYAVIRVLLEKSGKEKRLLLMRGDHRRTILHYATISGHLELFKLIVETAGKVFTSPEDFFKFLVIPDEYNFTALHLNALADYKLSYESILKHFDKMPFTKVIEEVESVLTRKGYYFDFLLDILSPIFQNDSRSSETGIIKLIMGKIKNSTKLHKLLSKENRLKHTVLHLSSMTDSLEIVKYIGQNLDWDDYYKLILQPDIYDMNALHWAVVFGRDRIFECMGKDIATNLPVEEQSKLLRLPNAFGKTVFHLAQERERGESFLGIVKEIFNELDVAMVIKLLAPTCSLETITEVEVKTRIHKESDSCTLA